MKAKIEVRRCGEIYRHSVNRGGVTAVDGTPIPAARAQEITAENPSGRVTRGGGLDFGPQPCYWEWEISLETEGAI